MPQPAFVHCHDSGDCVPACHQSKLWQPQYGWSGVKLVDLKASVDKLAIRQDTLIGLIDSQYQNLLAKLAELAQQASDPEKMEGKSCNNVNEFLRGMSGPGTVIMPSAGTMLEALHGSSSQKVKRVDSIRSNGSVPGVQTDSLITNQSMVVAKNDRIRSNESVSIARTDTLITNESVNFAKNDSVRTNDNMIVNKVDSHSTRESRILTRVESDEKSSHSAWLSSLGQKARSLLRSRREASSGSKACSRATEGSTSRDVTAAASGGVVAGSTNSRKRDSAQAKYRNLLGPRRVFTRAASSVSSELALEIEADTVCAPVKKIVHTRIFEFCSAGVIVCNMIALFVQLQWQSCELAQSVGHSSDDCGWQGVSWAFDLAEYAFNVWYGVELLLRLYAWRWAFFTDRLNLLDLLVMCMFLAQNCYQKMQLPGAAPMRFLRILRTLRVVRIIHVLLAFRELHILLKTLAASFYSLYWSMCLVGAVVWASGLLVMQLLDSYVKDPTQDPNIRERMFLSFGSPLRAVYSMFVATFSSQWVPMAREMIEHVNPHLGCFWVFYIVVVNFAVIRVIAALFLKQTMDVASHDTERRAMEGQREKEKFARVLHKLFKQYDTSGDGQISKAEFEVMIQSEHVVKTFESLGLEYEEVCALFDVMTSDDGYADYDEFLAGALQMKNSARTFDSIRIMHELGALARHVECLGNRLGGFSVGLAQVQSEPLEQSEPASADFVAMQG